jgi:hypothetical protein
MGLKYSGEGIAARRPRKGWVMTLQKSGPRDKKETLQAQVHDKAASEGMIVALRREQVDLALAFLAAGADPSARDGMGNSALMWAAGFGDEEAGRVVIEALAGAGADLEWLNEARENALMAAVDCEKPGAVRALLAAGADPESRGARESKPLIWAARLRRQSCLEELIAAGVELDARDALGCSAAMWSAKLADVSALAALAHAGADLTGGPPGQSALSMARQKGHEQCVALIESVEEKKALGQVADSGAAASRKPRL